MKLKTFVTAASLCLFAFATARADFLINELLINAPGSDDDQEYFEIQGAANSSLAGFWLVAIEGDDNSPGEVDYFLDLAPYSTDANGLFALQEDINGGLDFDFENGTTTYAIIEGFTGDDESDFDLDNDGEIGDDAADTAFWTAVCDAVGWQEEGANGDQFDYADDFGGALLPLGTFTPDTAFRDSITGEWYFADLDGSDYELGEFVDITFGDASGLPWDFTSTSFGAVNPTAVPEPGSAAFLAGIGLLFVRRRR